MLVSSKLFNLNIFLVTIALLVFQSCSSEEKYLKSESLENPEELKRFVENGVSEKDKKMAEDYPYSGAIAHRKKNGWSSASKGFAEASLLHPTAKYLIYLSEAEAKFLTQSRFGDEVAIRVLKRIK